MLCIDEQWKVFET